MKYLISTKVVAVSFAIVSYMKNKKFSPNRILHHASINSAGNVFKNTVYIYIHTVVP